MNRYTISFVVAYLLCASFPAIAGTVYVDASATGAGNGSSWANACTNLQGGLTAAGAGDDIWVARGTYKPTGGTNRAVSFQMKTDVSLYGGFTNGAISLADRDWNKHATVLSGEIGSTLHNDNSLHVVDCTGASGVTFDGFTVTRGYAWDADNDVAMPSRRVGGGFLVYQSEVFPTIQNCRFIDNSANYQGGGVAFIYNVNGVVGPAVSNCYFANNETWRGIVAEGGGGLYMYFRKPLTVEDCTFTSNTANYGSGLRSEYANTTIRRSRFSHNVANHSGSAIYMQKTDVGTAQDIEITDCRIYENTQLYYGAMHVERAYYAGDVISNCWIYANKATTQSGHGLYLNKYNGTVVDCVISGNRNYTASAGGGVILISSDPLLQRVAIVGSETAHRGGGLFDSSSGGSEPRFENVVVAGNRCRYEGAGLCLYNMGGNASTLINCVLTENETTESSASYGGGGLYLGNGIANITNCIIWGNSAAGSGDNLFVKTATSKLHVGNSDIEGGLAGIWNPDSAGITNSGGNIDLDPQFIVETGTWSASGVYDDGAGMTILTDNTASWETDELAGKFVKPDSSGGSFIYYVAANTKNTISILGDATDEAKITPYSITDYDLPINSPCVNAGSSAAPDHDFVLTPRPQPSGGASDIGIREYVFDSSAPDDISDLTMNPEHEQIAFGWTNPTNTDYSGLLVLRREGAAPTGVPTDTNSYVAGAAIGDGVVAYVGTGTNAAPSGNSSWISTDLTNGVIYHYRFFTFDGKPNYSAGLVTNGVPVNDDTAPSDVTDLTITSGDRQAVLSWTNPVAIDFEGVLILRRTIGRPGIPQDKKAYSIDDPIGGGTVVHVGHGSDSTAGAASTWTDTGLDNATMYYYQVFARDEAPNYSSGLETNTTTDADTVSPGVVDILIATASDAQVALTWWNPGASDFEGILILRRTGAAPTGTPTDNSTYSAGTSLGDGTIAYVGTGANGDPSGFSGWTDSGLSNGSNYYYAVFAYDEVLNYSAASEANATPAATAVIYVDWNASGSDSGSSWTDAYTSLQDALSVAVAGDSIWIAEGTYKPGTTETDCFDMKDGVDMFGGFTNGMGSISHRDWTAHKTILSGDVDNDGILDAENAYHVLSGADQAALDGFTVTMGYADGVNPHQGGGGLYVWDTADFPEIYNCSFVTNAGYIYGGALCLRYDTTVGAGPEAPIVSNCYFEGNYTWYAGNEVGGGAIYGYHRRPFTILDSTFVKNSSVDSDGGAILIDKGHPIIRGCTFAGNVSGRDAGAIWVLATSAGPRYPLEISSCVFYENSSAYYGGACYINRAYFSADIIEDCDFYSNESTGYGGGGLYLWTYDGTVRNCIFSGNRIAPTGADSKGGGIQMESSDCDIQNVIVVGSASVYRGGGIYAGTDSRPQLENVLIAGCRTRYDGGGICMYDLSAPESRSAYLLNCTIVSNETYDPGALYGGGGVYARNGTIDLRNNIIYGNTAAGNGSQAFISTAGSEANIDYSDIQYDVAGIWNPDGASVNNVDGNINVDPMFFGAKVGIWSAASTYDINTGITTMHDNSQAWEIDSLAGKFLNPKTGAGSNLLFYVSGNSQNALYVWGDASYGSSGNPYRLTNFRLDPDSECLNSGSTLGPATDVEGWPRPQGGGFDMGAYEGAAYTPPPKGTTILLYGIK